MNENIVHMEGGKLTSNTPSGHVRFIVDKAVQHRGDGGIVIHLHGGLVNEAAARGIAERLTPHYHRAKAFPIFFVWESGLVEVLKNNLMLVAREALLRKALKKVFNIVKRKASQSSGGRAVGSLPLIDSTEDDREFDIALDQGDAAKFPGAFATPADMGLLTPNEQASLEAELSLDGELIQIVQSLSNGLRKPEDIAADDAMRAVRPVVGAADTLMDPAAIDRLVDRPDPKSRGLISSAKVVKAVVAIAIRVIRRLVIGRGHGIHATVVEEVLREFYLANIGGKIWSMMKQDTADSFGPDPEQFGGTAVIAQLAMAAAEGKAPKVTLVGHSTGAVYISHWLSAADALMPADFKFDIVFLAPASTCSLMAETLTQHGHRIGKFRMFSMTDENERKDQLVPVLYPHSLLYFVSGVVEPSADTPIVGMQRYYDNSRYDAGGFPDVERVRNFMAQGVNRSLWSVNDDGPGLSTQALRHGDFDNDEWTVASVCHLLEHGF